MKIMTALLVSAALSAATVEAAVYYVASHGDNGNAGSQAAPWLTVQHALDSAAANDEIRVGEGRYSENLTYPAGRTNVTLRGGYNTNDWSWNPGAHRTIVSAAGSAAALDFTGASCTFSGFTLTGGNHGISTSSELATRQIVSHCVISNNVYDGIAFGANGSVLVYNTVIAQNGRYGVNLNANFKASPQALFYNVTVADNGDTGIYNPQKHSGTATLRNSIVAGNAGYGMEIDITQIQYDYTIVDSCVYGNVAGSFMADASSWPFSVTRLVVGVNVFSAPPRFAGGGDYRLQSGSRCVDAGADLSGAGIADDAYGTPRAGAWDLGAYESAHSAAALYADTYADASQPDDLGAATNAATATRSIGAALALTAPGGTCHVAAGGYDEQVLLTAHSVTLEGAGWGSTIVSNRARFHNIIVTGISNVVRRFGVRDSEWYGLYANHPGGHDPDMFLAEDCSFGGSYFGVQAPKGVTVKRCIVTNNVQHGIYTDNLGGAPRIYNSLIAGNSGDGINHNGGSGTSLDATIYGCTIAGNGGDGIGNPGKHISDSTTIRNCILAGNGAYGVSRETQQIQYWYRIVDSCVYGNSNGHFNILIDTGAAYESHEGNWGEHLFLIGTNVFAADPLFVGPGDYRLRNGSPCVEYGADLSGEGVTVDLLGTARTAPFDIGAYESVHAAAARHADTYVDASRPDDGGDGTSPATAKKTIGAGLGWTAPGGTCHVAAGVYREQVLMTTEGVTMAGAGRDATIVSNTTPYHVAVLAATGTTLADASFRGSQWHGVWVYHPGGQDKAVTIERCGMEGNFHGIHAYSGFVVSECIIATNTRSFPTSAYGIKLNTYASMYARNLLFHRNGADGIYNFQRGDYISESNSIFHCTFVENGGNGYESYWEADKTYLRNCIFSGNGAYGIYTDVETVRRGGFDDADAVCFHGNGAGTTFETARGDLILGGIVLTADPAFEAGGFELSDMSPCIDAGVDVGVSLDLAGVPRPLERGYDMGAYEHVPPAGTLIILR